MRTLQRDDLSGRPLVWQVALRNLNDGSVEGLAHDELPIFSVQYHPEAGPGPHDAHHLFDEFLGGLARA